MVNFRAIGHVEYEYNDLGELMRERRSDGRTVEYELDVCGRIVKKRTGNKTASKEDELRYDAVGAVLLPGVRFDQWMRPVQFNGESFEYDAEGRLVSRLTDAGLWHYEWDFVGNLTKVRAPRHAVQLLYDGRGRRVKKKVVSTHGQIIRDVDYVWSNQTLLHEVDLLSGWTRTYLRQPESWAPMGHVDSNGTEQRAFFYVTDASGMPDLAMDETGGIAWSAERSVFGELEIAAESSIELNVRFAGQLYDPDVELTYNRMRWYDARVGHYVSPDPTSLDGGAALRAYVSNPTAYIDPMGKAGFFPDFANPASVENKGTGDKFELAKPGPHATLGTAETPGFIDCPEDELKAGGHTPDSSKKEKNSGKFSKSTSDAIDKAGAAYGCHRCGSKNPNGLSEPQEGDELKKAQDKAHFVPDHVPPAMMHTSRNDKFPSLPSKDVVKPNKPSGVKLLPHCRPCATEQGQAMASLRGQHSDQEILDMGSGMISVMQGITPAK